MQTIENSMAFLLHCICKWKVCAGFLQTLEDSMGTATTLSTPQDQVESLMREVAAEAALDIEDQLKELNPTTASIRSEASASTDKEDQLSKRYV